jgi:D-arabinose 1-dehydrogenase-like Zn-dependent alcohol dehydrogenase
VRPLVEHFNLQLAECLGVMFGACCASAGAPLVITALDGEPGQAELTTDQGAIYVTNNKAYTWSAAVQETVDATLNRTVSSGEQRKRVMRVVRVSGCSVLGWHRHRHAAGTDVRAPLILCSAETPSSLQGACQH